jgi:hypothetical protein
MKMNTFTANMEVFPVLRMGKGKTCRISTLDANQLPQGSFAPSLAVEPAEVAWLFIAFQEAAEIFTGRKT